MKNKKYIDGAMLLLAGLIMISCEKDWLSAKPDRAMVVPKTFADFRAFLDNTNVFGAYGAGMGEAAADNAYLTQSIWESFYGSTEKNLFVWADDVYNGETNADWLYSYTEVLNANIAIEGIANLKFSDSDQQEGAALKGEAFFHRARAFYGLTQVFCKPYNPSTAGVDLGLPLKTTSDVNEIPLRATLEATYAQIFSDLNTAYQLLPQTSLYKTRPNKHTVLALKARIYLSMEDYEKAFDYANQSLAIDCFLIDYNTLDTNLLYPVPLFNDEVVYFGKLITYSSSPNLYGVVDSTLFKSYREDDLRKQVLFGRGNYGTRFTGNYNGDRLSTFCGVANDELFLIRAECHARLGSFSEAMDDLNKLLENRYAKDAHGISTYQMQTADNETDALNIILLERRKELVCRGVRWSDLRRLNKDPRFQVTLTRNLGGTIYTLAPNDPRYTFLIPPDEIIRAGLEQNPR